MNPSKTRAPLPHPLFADHGAGVGLRSHYYGEFQGAAPADVRWAEVISENYAPWPNQKNPRPLARLLRIRENIPIALHGVSLSIGSADPLDRAYLRSLRELIAAVQPICVSDHLCWTGVDGRNAHDLLPLPYTQEALAHVTEKILRAQDFLKRRILIENVSSYVEFSLSEMPEWEFLSQLCRRADCGLLLDINNVYVSSVNHRFNPLHFLEAIPAERVGQIHLAGHTVRDEGRYLIDTHDEPVCDEVWALYRWWVGRKGFQSAMVERDGNFPAWEELLAEIRRISEIRLDAANATRGRDDAQASSEKLLFQPA